MRLPNPTSSSTIAKAPCCKKTTSLLKSYALGVTRLTAVLTSTTHARRTCSDGRFAEGCIFTDVYQKGSILLYLFTLVRSVRGVKEDIALDVKGRSRSWTQKKMQPRWAAGTSCNCAAGGTCGICCTSIRLVLISPNRHKLFLPLPSTPSTAVHLVPASPSTQFTRPQPAPPRSRNSSKSPSCLPPS